ncbi:MAG: Na/Pi symporter [Ilumatobacter sp.]|jgi:solute carrier family 34 (sodium-dependent phosphate cotransporter)|uniref:Na/Pi symporter n=1 Tax=Ilumatobacter sp. TaxID=1967498 RepID=UPI001D3EFB17|nr:Na/Pi symporter [Ilumatobacter sp.]MBT5553465.1 Na/Pi symporter [Ilumatobacter sp.]MBT5865321.1 Na/Pi symporter [Ilumatobacter sp.]MBT7430668.1 Na/Pi symporter [Ilumatobacter sp.]MDG0976825.1 Na/Pi symporter [Ilumatobacter sp.]
MAIAAQEQPTRFDMPTWLRSALVFGLIYTFLVGVSALEKGIKIMGEDTQEKLFSSVDNPIAGLCVGILGTVLVQSSSASTSIIVGLVATGGISVEAAIPMIMGANIGTTVTNTLVSLGHVRQSSEFKRAFAAATVHDFFNVMAVALLLPLELLTGVVSKTATWMSDRLVGTAGSEWKSPVKTWVKKPVEWIVDIWEAVGLNGNVLGTTVVLTGLVIVLLSLTFITKNMRELVADRVERSVNNVLGKGSGSIAMLLGLAITVAVQSSSITTSILIPLAAAGVLSLRNAYPVTLGANVGTTITALLAALAASVPEALTVGLAHTTFNVMGIALLYVPRFIRYVPVQLAEGLAEVAFRRPAWAVVYVMTAFIVLPLIGVGIFG